MDDPLDRKFFDRARGQIGVQNGQPVVRRALNPAVCVDPVATMSNTEKLHRTLLHALSTPDLSSEVQKALSELLNPTSLSIAAGVLAVWAASHFVGVGEIADVVVIGIVYFSLGTHAVQGLVSLVEFGVDIINARCDLDLRRAAAKLVRAFVLLGVEVVVGLLTRKAQIKIQHAKGSPRGGNSAAKPATTTSTATTVRRHKAGNRQVEVNGQTWHLPEKVSSDKIPAVDSVGDRLHEVDPIVRTNFWAPLFGSQPTVRVC